MVWFFLFQFALLLLEFDNLMFQGLHYRPEAEIVNWKWGEAMTSLVSPSVTYFLQQNCTLWLWGYHLPQKCWQLRTHSNHHSFQASNSLIIMRILVSIMIGFVISIELKRFQLMIIWNINIIRNNSFNRIKMNSLEVLFLFCKLKKYIR